MQRQTSFPGEQRRKQSLSTKFFLGADADYPKKLQLTDPQSGKRKSSFRGEPRRNQSLSIKFFLGADTEYPKKVQITEPQSVKRRGSVFDRRRSSITALLVKPPPGLRWMSLEVWKCIKWLVAWTLYCIIGALIFIKLEEVVTHEETVAPHPHWKKFKELLTQQEQMEELLDLKKNLIKMCDHTFLNQSFSFELSDVDGLPVWRRDWDEHGEEENRTEIANQQESLLADLKDVETACRESLFVVQQITHYEQPTSVIDAMYYTMTAVTTIGYGHICPTTTANKIFCVLYCLIGVPLTCIFLNNSSEFLSIQMLGTYKRVVKRYPDNKVSLLYLITAFYLTLGFIVFMFIPSVALMFTEGWTYLDSFYFTFITLSTIGFGDFIAAGDNNQGGWATVYKLIIIVWIMIGLGYWILLLKFVTKALKKSSRKFTKTFSSKVITEQATFFRHMVRKVKNVHEDKHMTRGINVTPSQHNMMDLMKEVEGALSGKADNDGQPIRPRSVSQGSRTPKFNKPSFPNGNVHKLHSENDGDNASGFTAASYNTEATDEDSDLPLSLRELLSVHVVVRSDNVSVMKNIITQVAKEDEGLPETDKTPEEVTLPLRDVLNLMILIATIEDQINNQENMDESNLCTPAESMWSVITKDNPRDSLPLLKDMFLNGRPRLHQLRE